MRQLPDHVIRNAAIWDASAPDWVADGKRHWRRDESSWGKWELSESELQVLGEVSGLDVVELWCGTAYWCAWLERRGARPVGVDISEAQLATARALRDQHRLQFPLLNASAEATPLPDASFDLALSEYGASLYCEPEAWVTEAARLLRPEGRLVFMTNSPLATMCAPDDGPATARLLRAQREIRRLEWPGEAVEFHLSHGEWIAVLRAAGFRIEDLREVYAPRGATPTRFGWMPPNWARRWAHEDIWVARRA